ncbi:MAG: hypothetical protein QOE61_1075, partial [Micromonosporaceae bacterium]|nr:hypothetical protein [Micromonosporaceae bacterium]
GAAWSCLHAAAWFSWSVGSLARSNYLQFIDEVHTALIGADDPTTAALITPAVRRDAESAPRNRLVGQLFAHHDNTA